MTIADGYRIRRKAFSSPDVECVVCGALPLLILFYVRARHTTGEFSLNLFLIHTHSTGAQACEKNRALRHLQHVPIHTNTYKPEFTADWVLKKSRYGLIRFFSSAPSGSESVIRRVWMNTIRVHGMDMEQRECRTRQTQQLNTENTQRVLTKTITVFNLHMSL